MKKALIFGAGNIGRGFLGVLLRQSGYSVTFVDVDRGRVDLINQYGEYPVFVCSKTRVTEQMVIDVSALHFSDTEGLTTAVCESDVILTAVGKSALQHVALPIAVGIVERNKRRPGHETHIVVIACENVHDNTAYLAGFVKSALGD